MGDVILDMGCLIPGCGGVRKVRGLCGKCHGRAIRAVKAGRDSWEAMEAEGRCLARKRTRSDHAWFHPEHFHHDRMILREDGSFLLGEV